MSAFAQILTRFHDAILDADAGKSTADVKRNPRLSPEEQLAIYIEGYRLRFMEVLRSDYPALLYFLGGGAFETLASQYAEQTPSTGYNLDRYAHGFASFVCRESKDAFARDLATLEGAIAEVFMMEESAPLTPEKLATLTTEDFGDLRLKPRLASRLLRFEYPAEAYLKAQRDEQNPVKPAAKKTYLTLVRHQNEVKRHALSETEYAALTALAAGEPVGKALENASESDAGSWFGKWMAHGFFTS